MRTRARVDANQKEIVEGLRKMGLSVLHTHQLKGCFDILVGHKGFNFAFEIKDPEQPPSKRRLTPDERTFFDGWNGQVDKIESLDDILEIIKVKLNYHL